MELKKRFAKDLLEGEGGGQMEDDLGFQFVHPGAHFEQAALEGVKLDLLPVGMG